MRETHGTVVSTWLFLLFLTDAFGQFEAILFRVHYVEQIILTDLFRAVVLTCLGTVSYLNGFFIVICAHRLS